MAEMTAHATYAELRRRWQVASVEERRVQFETGAAFASFSIMTPTEDAERLLRRWVEAGCPVSLEGLSEQLRATREHRLVSVRALLDSQIAFLGMTQSPNTERIFAQLTWGYGPTKASFAMACAGIGYLPCIDRRLQAKYAIPDRDLEKWPSYLDWCERLYPGVWDKASAGANEWLTDLARDRYATQHELLLGLPAPQLELPL